MVKTLEKINGGIKQRYHSILGVMVVSVLVGAVGLAGEASAATLHLSVADTISVDVLAVRQGGSFAKSGNSAITASTDNATGYTLTIEGTDNSGQLKNGSNYLSSIAAATSENDFKSTSTAGEQYNGQWGYLPDTLNSTANSSFQPAPTTTGDLIARTSSANASGESDTYNIAIGARVDQSVPVGSYTNTFVVRLVSNAVPYSFTYDDNVVSNMPSDTMGEASSGTTAISSKVPVRDGYTFLGWCPGTVTTTGDTDTCSTTVVAPGGSVATAGASNDYTFVAMWEKAAPATPYIQDYALATCAAEASDNVTVKDKRDDNEYTVKYINNECWMTQNLRYLGDTGSAAKTMTIGGNNSNVANTSITLYSLDSSNAGNFNAYSSHCDSTNGYNYACVYDSGSDTTGVWYNYYAASGGTISGGSNSTAATSDICPSGWHLPSGPNTISGTDYNKLVGNTTSGWQNPTAGLTAFGAVAGGRYYNGSLYSTGYGLWWSATATGAATRYRLSYDSSDGQFGGDVINYRYYGLFVRCVRSSYVASS